MNKVKLVKLDFNQIAELSKKHELIDFKCAENAFDFNFFENMGLKLELNNTNVHSFYVIYCPTDKLAIGVVAFKQTKNEELEIIYMLDGEYRQKGYAKLAVRKALKEIQEDKVIDMIVAYTPKGNKNSILTENNFEAGVEFDKYIEWQLLNNFY